MALSSITAISSITYTGADIIGWIDCLGNSGERSGKAISGTDGIFSLAETSANLSSGFCSTYPIPIAANKFIVGVYADIRARNNDYTGWLFEYDYGDGLVTAKTQIVGYSSGSGRISLSTSNRLGNSWNPVTTTSLNSEAGQYLNIDASNTSTTKVIVHSITIIYLG